ncbi:MAG: gamma-glutamylcyclotransferase family protein [Pseudomonadota bacterium]
MAPAAHQAIYFAYGSNMMTTRLQARCTTARPIGVATLDGYNVGFNKQSSDGSGKAGLIEELGATTFGVAFTIDMSDLITLDRFEGTGYARVSNLMIQMVRTQGGSAILPSAPIDAVSYLPRQITQGLKPYDWYLGLILAGCREHALPETYWSEIAQAAADPDPDPSRAAAREAHRLLKSI